VSAEAREDLRHAYITVIKVGSVQEMAFMSNCLQNMPSALVPKIFQKHLVDGLLSRLNAKPEALEPATETVLHLLAATGLRNLSLSASNNHGV
jgi:hypothetical protein